MAVDTYADGADAAVTTDNVQAGQISCQYFIDKLGGKGNVIIENGPSVSSVIDRVKGCKDALAKAPAMKLLSSDQDAKGQRDAGLNVMKSLLTRFPDVQAVFTINDPQALGSNLAAVHLNRKNIVITSVDGQPDMPERDRAHVPHRIEASSSQDPYVMARKAVDIGVDLLNGKAPAEKVTLLPSALITRDNVKDYKGWQADRTGG